MITGLPSKNSTLTKAITGGRKAGRWKSKESVKGGYRRGDGIFENSNGLQAKISCIILRCLCNVMMNG